MAMKRRSALDIRRLQDDRRKHPQSRYKMEPHERRELETLVAEQGRPVDADMVKMLSTYFVVTQGTIMQNLEGLGINTDLVAQGSSPKPQPKTEAPGRPTLHIGGKKKNKTVKKTTSKDLSAPEKLEAQALKEEQNKLRLAQVQLQQREADIERKQRAMDAERAHWASVEQDLEESEQMLADLERRHTEEIERIKSESMPVVKRDPEAEVQRVYTSGQLFQTLMVREREHELEVAGLRRAVRLLEADLQNKEAQGRQVEWQSQRVDTLDSMQVM